MPNQNLPTLPPPEWLLEIIRGKTPGKLPLKKLLVDSLYYPASGINGTPIKFLVGNVYSFIYADLGTGHEEFLRDLRHNPPLGYDLIYQREVTVDEIAESNFVPAPFEISATELNLLLDLQCDVEPFGHWSIWRSLNSDLAFSLFFLRGEINAVFQGLYVQNHEKPKYLAIIQPGHADGILAWEDIRSNNSHFHDLVIGNPAGAPEYIISGHTGSPEKLAPYWDEYAPECIAYLQERSATISKLKNN